MAKWSTHLYADLGVSGSGLTWGNFAPYSSSSSINIYPVFTNESNCIFQTFYSMDQLCINTKISVDFLLQWLIFYMFKKVYFTLTFVKIISCFNLMLIIQVVRYIMYLYYRELILSLCRVLFDIKYIFNKIVFRQIIQMTRTSKLQNFLDH